MRARRLAFAIATVLLVQLLPAGAGSKGIAAEFHSDNMTHVKNIPQQNIEGNTGGGGSDIEFVSLDVTDLPEALDLGVTGVREFALGGSLNKGMQIYDITDPENTELASIYDCKIAQGDIQVFTREDGRTYATYTADYDAVLSSTCYQDIKAMEIAPKDGMGTFIVDLTNPYAPRTVTFIYLAKGSHNMTVHPSGNFLYNSNNELTEGIGLMEIVDITAITEPKVLEPLDLGTGIDSHDITFNADGTRAYSAAVSHSLVMDTTDPSKPTIIGRIIDPTITIHHQSEPITIDTGTPLGVRDFLVVTDEVGGGSAGSVCPGGAIHIFDITGDLETAPVKLGVYEAPVVKPAGGGTDATGSALGCTSHVLRFYPEQKLMTIAWYNAGVHVVDISTILGPSVGITLPVDGGPTTGSLGVGMKELGYYWFSDSNTWSAKTNKFAEDGSFYLYANDISRGLDIFHYSSAAPTSTATGKSFSPSAYAALVAKRGPRPAWEDVRPYCLLKSSTSPAIKKRR
ncbi:MAG: hypothetical protein GEU71_02550 [Actinobacteria bacterium]|nr:hypothetical protein [Actinomycetota bacterium]